MEILLRNRGLQFVDITLRSTYFASISVSFEVTLPLDADQDETLNAFSNYFSMSFTSFGNFTVREENRGLTQVSAAGELTSYKCLFY